MFLLLTFFIFIIFLWKLYTRKYPDEPPLFPGAWPLLGHAHFFFGNTLNFWKVIKTVSEKSMEMGHATLFFIGPIKFYVITDPDDVNKVSNVCFQKDNFSYKFTKDLLGDGLLFSQVPTWKKHRKLINPAFNQQILDSFMGIFNSQGKRLVTRLQVEVDKGPFDHSNYVRQNFMETICLTAIDNAVSEDDAIKYVQAFEAYLNLNISRFIKFWLHSDFIFKFSNTKKLLNENSKVLTEMSDSVLKKKRALRNNGIQKKYNEIVPKVKVFMDLMMDLDGEVLTDQEIKDEINTIIMAGHDTSATVTVFALLLIGSYPEVQERIYKELREVLGDKDDVEKQDLSRLVYLEAVLKETMRYYVMAPIVGRFIDREVKLSNCTLKPGYNCFLMMYAIHRNPLWGPDVNEFKPERWLDPATMPKNPNMFVGFSTGKRNCIGKAYAMMSIKVLLSHLLRRYKLHGDHTKMVLKLDVLLKPVTGHLITIEDRLRKK